MKKVFWIFGLTLALSIVLIAMAISDEVAQDPVCGMEVNPAEAQWKVEGKGGTVYFCSESCMLKFCEDPKAYLAMEKLEELQICVTGLCTEKDCCPKDSLQAVDVNLDDIPCAGCTGCLEDTTETKLEEHESNPGHDQMPH